MSQERGPWKLLDLLTEATGFLGSKAIEHPRLEAELMLAASLEVRRIDLYLQFEKILTGDEVAAFRGLVRQRLAGRPVQYVTGEAAFRLLELTVDERVLVPRPETEILVEVALAGLQGRPTPAVLDVGCGSGAVAIALAAEAPGTRVTATDLSLPALTVARANAARNGVDGRVTFLCADLLAALAPASRFDAIVSNPPYVTTGELADLQPEVRDYEPRLALDGGFDGLEVVRRLAAAAPAHLVPGGQLLLEVGAGQAPAVGELLVAAGFIPDSVHIRRDLAGIERVVAAAVDG